MSSQIVPIWTPEDTREVVEVAAQFPSEVAESPMLADLMEGLA